MAIKAKRDFTDKNTGKYYKKGEIIKVEKSVEDRYLKSPYDVAEKIEENKEVKEYVRKVQAKANKKSENTM